MELFVNRIKKSQLNPDSMFNLPHLSTRQFAFSVGETSLADSCQLICHGFARSVIYHDDCFTRICSINIRCQRNYLHTVQIFVRSIIAQNHRRSLFVDLSTNRWFEIHPPNFTAFHHSRLPPSLLPSRGLRLRAARLLPFGGRQHPAREK